jgi:hypothetical protein
MLICKEMTEIITDYLEGRMPLMTRLSLQLHLGGCRPCRAYLRQMKMAMKTAGLLPIEAITPDGLDTLVTQFRNWKA